MGSIFTRPAGSKKARLDPTCKIDRLADADLAQIFMRLPPYDRLRVAEVCRRWNAISRKVWTEITYLDLSSIPGRQIAPIVSQCPNLQTVLALNKTFGLDELHILASVNNLRSVKLYNCKASIPNSGSPIHDVFSHIFSSSLRSAPWTELVLHKFEVNIAAVDGFLLKTVDVPATLPATLKHLQIIGLQVNRIQRKPWGDEPFQTASDLHGLEQLQSLECLMVSYSFAYAYLRAAFVQGISLLSNLRELCLFNAHGCWAIASQLPRLEALFLNRVCRIPVADGDDDVPLVTKHPTLRILVITGEFCDDIVLPARRRYPNGFHAAPVPTLHVFVGKSASEKIRFAKSSNDTLKIYPISESLPQFLERKEIAPLFEGVWLAAKIKEATSQGAAFMRQTTPIYAADDAATLFRYLDD